MIPAPLPVRVTRSGSTDHRAVVRRYALDAYARGDFHSAESLFRQALVGAEDDAETLLYYASTLRLIGRESSAIAALEAARGTMPTARVDAEVAWQLANAYLAVGREEDAAVLLDTLSDSTSHGTRATDLLRELDA